MRVFFIGSYIANSITTTWYYNIMCNLSAKALQCGSSLLGPISQIVSQPLGIIILCSIYLRRLSSAGLLSLGPIANSITTTWYYNIMFNLSAKALQCGSSLLGPAKALSQIVSQPLGIIILCSIYLRRLSSAGLLYWVLYRK